jgi:hypothetical protein
MPIIFPEKIFENYKSYVYLPPTKVVPAAVMELVDMLDLGFNLIKVLKILKKRAWWNW